MKQYLFKRKLKLVRVSVIHDYCTKPHNLISSQQITLIIFE